MQKAWKRLTERVEGCAGDASDVFVKTSKAKSNKDISKFEKKDVANTLNSFDIGEVRSNEYVIDKQKSYGINGHIVGRKHKNGSNGIGVQEECAHSLTTADKHSVAIINDQGGDRMDVCYDKSNALSVSHSNENYIVADFYNCTIQKDKTNCISTNVGNSQPYKCGNPHVLKNNDKKLYENHAQDCRYKELKEHSNSVVSTYGTGGNNQPFVVDMGAGKSGCNINKDLSPTLATTHGGEPVVVGTLSKDLYNNKVEKDITNTLTATDYKEPPMVACIYSRKRNVHCEKIEESCETVRAGYGTAGTNVPLTLQVRSGKEGGGKGALVQEDLSATLNSTTNQTLFDNKYNNCIVRRLTPTECGRLQGFPD